VKSRPRVNVQYLQFTDAKPRCLLVYAATILGDALKLELREPKLGPGLILRSIVQGQHETEVSLLIETFRKRRGKRLLRGIHDPHLEH